MKVARTPPAARMAAGTALSRGTGLLRTMALASALGVSVTSDAYNTESDWVSRVLVGLVSHAAVG